MQHDEVAEELYVPGLQHEVQAKGIALHGTAMLVSRSCHVRVGSWAAVDPLLQGFGDKHSLRSPLPTVKMRVFLINFPGCDKEY